MTLDFLESELRLGLKDQATLRVWQLHYLRQAQDLLALAGQWGHDRETQRRLDLGADLCAFQAGRLKAIAEQRELLDGEYIRSQLVGARHEWRMRTDNAQREVAA